MTGLVKTQIIQKMKDKKVCIVGLGYIGLPTMGLIASKGFSLVGVDVDSQKIAALNKGEVYIFEDRLEELIQNAIKNNKIKAQAIPTSASVYMIAVPTPLIAENKSPDIIYVKQAIQNVIPHIKEGDLIIIESTCPIGTTEKMQQLIYEARPQLKDKIFLAYCPERVLPGNILYELENNDRVIGGIDKASTEKAVEFYTCFVKGNLFETNAKTAEMCKLVENASRDVNIAFANELSMISDKAGIDVMELIYLANKHPRVNILQPGIGVGGHCIAIDPWFIASNFPKEGKMIRTAREINDYKTLWTIDKIKDYISKFTEENQKQPTVAFLGLTFKPDVDDIRTSPALFITRQIVEEGYNVIAVEPHIEECKNIKLVSYDEALQKADIVFKLVAHTAFKDKSESNIINLCYV